MEEGGSESRSCYRSRKKEIQISKYISEVLQKHRLLDRKRYGTSSDQRRKRNLAMARFIEKHRNTGQIVSGEGEGPTFCDNSELITGILFGRPIIQSFSKMLSEYCLKTYDVDLEDVKVLEYSGGLIAKGDGGRLAKWLHVNYTAKHKDGSEKLYFAEVIVFMFRSAPWFCHVVTCLPADDDGSGTCKCLLPGCGPKIQHPNENAYVDDSLSPVSSTIPLWSTARLLFLQLFWYCARVTRDVWLAKPSWQGDPIPVDKLSRYDGKLDPRQIGLRRGGSCGAEAKKVYLYRRLNRFPKMSKDIPVPKIFLLSAVKKQSNDGLAQVQKRALAIAKHIENCKKPRKPAPIKCPLFDTLLRELPKFCRDRNGYDLEAINGFIVADKICPEELEFTQATWLHMNFSAKRKNDESGVSENLYFAEVVEIGHLLQDPIYKIEVCVPVDKNDPSGKCGICNQRGLQIYHPSRGSYIDDTSKMDPSEFSEWKEGPNSFEEVFRTGMCCGQRFCVSLIV